MHKGEVLDPADVVQGTEPSAVLFHELPASPVDGFRGGGIESIQRRVRRAVFIMVAFDAGGIHGAHNVDAGFWVGAVPDEIAQEGVMSACLLP